MVSVRRVAPILFLAVTTAAWAAPQAATKTDTQAPATTKKTAKSPATTSTATAPAPAPTTTSPATKKAAAPAMTTPAPVSKTTTAKPEPKAASKKSTKPAAKKAAAKPAEKPAPKKAAAKPAAKKPAAKTAAAKSTRPPKNLHKVGDHWTPYNPPDPATYPAGAKTYTIKPGDTLWGLATQFYSNGYMWPQLWEANTWITDAHWIYPGDVLLVEGEIAQQAEGGGATGAAGAAGTTGGKAGATAGGTIGETTGNPLGGQIVRPIVTAADAIGGTAGPVPLAQESDIYCYGYIGDPNEPLPNSIGAWEDAELRYQPGAVIQSIDGSEGDLAYIDGGSSTGLTAGETYILVVPRELVKHPTDRYQIIGRQYQYVGQLRVLCVDGDRSRGIITRSCAEVPVGARLKPLPQLPIPLARIPAMPAFCDPASGKRMGFIISSQGGDWLEALGEGYLVQINLGRDDQVMPGEFLTVYRANPPEGQRQILGELAVLTAEAHTATAKIVLMRYNMRVGDNVEIR